MNQRQLFLAHLAQTSPFPMGLEVSRAQGVYLYDSAGKKYIDLIAGIGVSSLGHCHPAVVAAVQEQAQTFLHVMVYGEFILAPQVALASLLAQSLPQGLDNVYFTNSGTEATEGAMKLAKRYTGRTEFIAASRSYHGSTQGAASLMWPKDFTRAYHPLLPGIRHIDFNCDLCLERITNQTAAVILETVQAEWGIRKPRPAWLQAVKKRCEEVGALLILDEIQAGYGRTGTLWAFEQYGIVPDILLLAKGMGGGMPIGAFIASKEVMQSLSERPILGHITTFGGHPVSCAAGLATLRTLLGDTREEGAAANSAALALPGVPCPSERSDSQNAGVKNATMPLIRQVAAKEEQFLRRLRLHPKVLDVRSAGLWMAVELFSFEEVQKVIAFGLENGLIADWFLFNERSIRIAPPLLITAAEIDAACDILLAGLDRL